MIPDADLPVWTFRPNWQGDVLERLMFMTDVLASNSGAEQRRGLRSTPRRSFDFDLLLSARERAFYDLMMARLSGYDWLLPIWHDLTGLTAAADIGATTLNLPTDLREFAAGGYAVMILNAFTYERVQIDTVGPTSLTLVEPTARAWPLKTKVYPLRRAKFDDQPSLARKTAGVMTGSVRFNLIGQQPWTAIWEPNEYLGYPVLDVAPNAVQDLDYKFFRQFEEADNDTGLAERLDLADRAFNSQAYNWLIAGRPANAAFRDMLYALDGRRKALWIPSYNDDLRFIGRHHADTVGDVNRDFIDFEHAGYRFAAGGAGAIVGREYVRVAFADGSFSYHQVLGTDLFELAAGRERLILTPWLTAGSGDLIPAIRGIQFMNLMRLDNDQVELSHKTDAAGATTVSATFKSFRDADAPVQDPKTQSGQESNAGEGVVFVLEIESPHNDPDLLFHGFNSIRTQIPELGSDPHDTRTVSFVIDQADVLALCAFSGDGLTAPDLSGSGTWIEDASGVYNGAQDYAYVMGHQEIPTRGTDVEATATWPAPIERTTGFLVLLNKAKLIQSKAAGFAVVGGATLDNFPKPGNWLVQIQLSVNAGVPNIHVDPHWERRANFFIFTDALHCQVFMRRLPG